MRTLNLPIRHYHLLICCLTVELVFHVGQAVHVRPPTHFYSILCVQVSRLLLCVPQHSARNTFLCTETTPCAARSASLAAVSSPRIPRLQTLLKVQRHAREIRQDPYRLAGVTYRFCSFARTTFSNFLTPIEPDSIFVLYTVYSLEPSFCAPCKRGFDPYVVYCVPPRRYVALTRHSLFSGR